MLQINTIKQLTLTGFQQPNNELSFGRGLGKMTFLIWLALSGFAGVITSNARAQSLPIPFDEQFQSGSLDSSWKMIVSKGAALEVKNGAINFDAPIHTRADIRRQIDTDLITFDGKIAQWGSIYLVWNTNDWCGIGQLSPTPFGQLYSAVVTNGVGGEVDHRGVDFGSPRWVRIQLGGNYIRFCYSDDGKNWVVLRTIERPKDFVGAPKLIVAGKYYNEEDKPFLDDNAFQEGDGRVGGRIFELRVESTLQDQLNLAAAELEQVRKPYVEPVSALLKKDQNDPTFTEIAKYYPAMKFPREIIGVPFHPLAIGVDWLGRLDVSPWTAPVAWFEIGDPAMPIWREDVPIKRRLLHGYLPIDTLTATRDGVEYEMSIFGWSNDFKAGQPLFAYARVFACAANGATLPPQIELVSPDKKRRTLKMAPTKNGEAELYLKFEFPKPDSAVEITPDEFDSKLNEVATRWKSQLAAADKFDVPDARVMEAYRAWLTYSMLNTKTVNGYLEPHDGSGFYDSMFGVSVSTYTGALDYYGFHDDAAKILGTQMHFQQTNGLYTQDCGLVDPGSFLVALAKHYQMTGDREWLQRVSPHIISQCNWLINQRAAAPQDGPVRGLIKFRPYNDYPDPVYNYLGNAWCAEGMAQAARALKDIDAPEASDYALEAAKYRNDILHSMDAAAFVNEGQTILPLEPDTHRLLKLSRNLGGGYYGLSASCLLETELLPPNDQRTSWIVDMLENRGGLIAGLCEFENGIDHAYTYGYLMNELKRGEVRKTLLGFWSMFAFGMTRDTYSPVEVTMIHSGDNQYTLPHTFSLSEQLRLFRNLLLREDGDSLWIGQGIPRAWLEPGKQVAVTSAPTEFGDVSCRIDSESNGAVHISLDPPSRRTPGEIHLCLREPHGREIASVVTTPIVKVAFSNETIILPNLQIPVDLQVEFKN